ncbi:hypothetical protein JXA85_03145 [Candidatus Woesearchaeota archaeon]|nr:hypothetical protein [Candidatus Woesearchaeota archaeon]
MARSDRNKGKDSLSFVLKFSLLFIVLTLISRISFISNATVWLFIQISRLLLVFCTSCILAGNQIIINNNPLLVVKECTGITMYVLFFSFAMSYRPRTRQILEGLALLFGLNLLRLITIFIAAGISMALLNFIHDFLWPASFFIFTLIAAALYIRRTK